MSRSEELSLITAAQNGSPAAEEALLAQWEGLVTNIAGADEDARQEGRLALLGAIRRFDPARGCRLSTYATPSIRRAVLTWEREQRLITIPRYRSAEDAPACGSLDEASCEDGELLLDRLVDPHANTERDALDRIVRDGALRLLGVLPDPLASALWQRCEGRTFAEIGAALGVCGEAVRHRCKVAVGLLKAEL